MHPIKEGVTVQSIAKHIEDGTFRPIDSHISSASDMLDSLRKWESALSTMREPAPVAAD